MVWTPPTRWHSPEMPYALNLLKLGFLVLLPGGGEGLQIQQHPAIVAEQKLQYWSAVPASSTTTVLPSFNASRRVGINGTFFGGKEMNIDFFLSLYHLIQH